MKLKGGNPDYWTEYRLHKGDKFSMMRFGLFWLISAGSRAEGNGIEGGKNKRTWTIKFGLGSMLCCSFSENRKGIHIVSSRHGDIQVKIIVVFQINGDTGIVVRTSSLLEKQQQHQKQSFRGGSTFKASSSIGCQNGTTLCCQVSCLQKIKCKEWCKGGYIPSVNEANPAFHA